MAKKVSYSLVDDIDGGAAHETVDFALDGVRYEIDLSADHAVALRDALAPYLAVARRTRGSAARRPRGRRSAGEPAGASAGEMRDWGRAHGFEVSERGRIPANLADAYHAAH
ncbi:MAG: histone-like nucleoid-structuring protein Lsr2 [Mycobacteriales bacterium]